MISSVILKKVRLNDLFYIRIPRIMININNDLFSIYLYNYSF